VAQEANAPSLKSDKKSEQPISKESQKTPTHSDTGKANQPDESNSP
jgi:hypothetical protein